MRKLLNKPWFVVTLALAAVLLIGRDYFLGGKQPAAPAPEAVEEGLPAGEDGETVLRLSAADALKALVLPATVRDPFALPPKAAATEAEQAAGAPPEVVARLHVSAIWVQGASVLLLANGRVCQPGDTVDRFTIETAAIDGAWIAYPGGRSFVPVGQECTVKTTVPTVPVPLSQ